MKKSFSNNLAKGFTLIELLIVIAVLGILATAILVSLDPVEQLNRGRDSGRMSTVTQIGKAVQAYYTGTAFYPAETATWQNTLEAAGEIQRVVNLPAGGPTCGTLQQGRICYDMIGTTDATVWTLLESKWAKTKAAPAGAVPCANTPAAVWIASKGQAGYACLALPGSVPTAATVLY